MDRRIANRIIRNVPPRHWLPLAVVAAVTLIFVSKFTLDAVVAVARAGRGGEETQSVGPDDAIVRDAAPDEDEGGSAAPQDPFAVQTAAVPAAAAEPPGEPMVPESTLRLVVESLERKDEVWSKVLTNRDAQIEGLNNQLTQLRGEMGRQQVQLAEIRSRQAQDAWDESAERIRERATFGVRSKSSTFQIEERNGVGRVAGAAAPAVQNPPAKTEAARAADPFAADTELKAPTQIRSPSKRLPVYINVSSKRRSTGGRAPGSSASRLQRRDDRYQAAIEFTRKYNSRSATDRLLSEMERGHR